MGSAWCLPREKRDDVREYQPDIHSLTQWTYAPYRGRGTALTCLCLRHDKARVRKKQTVHEITPISHGETEADARKRKARTRPGRSRKQDCLLASLALRNESNGRVHVRGDGVCQTTGERSHEISCGVYTRKGSSKAAWSEYAWKHGKKDARTPEALPRISITGRRPQEQKEADRFCIPYLHFDVTK